jgi:hypothetical protein
MIYNIIFTSSLSLAVNTLSGIVQGTTTTLNVIYNLLSSTKSYNNYEKELKDLDIELKLTIFFNWLNNPKNLDNKSDNFVLLYNNINNICMEIQNTLDKIKQEISYHNTKYFSYWRTLNINDMIESIKKNLDLIYNRILLLNLS